MLPWFVLAASAAELPQARLTFDEPATPRELDAERRLSDRACPRGLSAIPIGLGRICDRRPVEGLALLGITAIDGAILASGLEHPYGAVGGGGLQNVVFTSISADVLDGWLRHQRRYTAPETLGELVVAPFRPVALAPPGVWIPTLVWTGAAVTTLVLVDRHFVGPPERPRGRPDLFGWSAPPALGYPLGAAVLGESMLHVAVGEELLFRGVIQGALSRALGPTPGWLVSSVLFVIPHLPNWLLADEEIRDLALIVGPVFVGTGSLVLGGMYQGHGYRLSHTVASHFWYNFALSMTGFVMYPETSTLSARITLPF